MLILSRKPNESLIILDDDGKTARVIISVLAVEGEKVKLGITAPREVGILRKELWQTIQEQSEITEHLPSQPNESKSDDTRKFPNEEASEAAPEPDATDQV